VFIPHKNCPVCGAGPGTTHQADCEVERCPNCGGQLVSCSCMQELIICRLPWSGDWPGTEECREFGWYAKLVPGVGWVPCGRDEPGAGFDFNRLHTEAEWDPLAGRFVKRDEV
jgi:hypothetical protein